MYFVRQDLPDGRVKYLRRGSTQRAKWGEFEQAYSFVTLDEAQAVISLPNWRRGLPRHQRVRWPSRQYPGRFRSKLQQIHYSVVMGDR